MSKEINADIDRFLQEQEKLKGREDLSFESQIEQEIEAMKNKDLQENARAVGEAVYPQTLEGKYLQPIYDVADPLLKAASIFEKPISLSMGLGRSVGKLVSGQDEPLKPIIAEASSLFPTPEGSLLADFNEAGIGTEPILGSVLPEEVKAQFPKASTFVEQFSPNNAAEMLASGAAGAYMPKSAGATRTKMMAGDYDLAEAALARSGGASASYLKELKKSGKLDQAIQRILDDKTLSKNLSNPRKIDEYLNGIKKTTTNPVTGERLFRPIVEGKLAQIGKEIEQSAKNLSKQTKAVDVVELEKAITNRIVDKINEIGSGMDIDPSQVKVKVSRFLRTPDMEALDDIDTNFLDVEDLVKLKRGAADDLYKVNGLSADPKMSAIDSVIANEVWGVADEMLNNKAAEAGDFSFIKNNNAYSDYMAIENIYKDAAMKSLNVPSMLSEIMGGLAVGGGTAIAFNNPYAGALAGGAYPMARSMSDVLSTQMPANALNLRRNYMEPALNVMSKVSPMVPAAALMAYQIPRNSDEILQNTNMFIAKLSQNIKTKEDISLYEAVIDTLNNKPEQISAMLPTLMQAYPQLFKQDRYGRINGIIHDPILKQKAIEDIVKDKGSSVQNAKKMQDLINNNRLEGE